MAGKDITNRQLLQALHPRFDKLEDMIAAIGDTLVFLVDNMATRKDLEGLRKGFRGELEGRLNDLELRLGRRIDRALTAKTAR